MMIINVLISTTKTEGKLLHDKNHTVPWEEAGIQNKYAYFS